MHAQPTDGMDESDFHGQLLAPCYASMRKRRVKHGFMQDDMLHCHEQCIALSLIHI